MPLKALIILIVFSICFSVLDLRAQEKNDSVVQFSGVIVTGDSLRPLPFVHVQIVGSYYGTVSDISGFFSFAAYKGDSVLFSSMGYRNSIFVIPDTLKTLRYSIFQMMQSDTLLLKETIIYPWPTIESLESAIVNYQVPEDDYDRAMKNLAIQEMKERADKLPMDGSMNYRHQMQNYINKSYYNGQYMPNQLLNPFAWSKFIKAWQEGKFRRK